MPCGLCGSDDPLCRSHIIPEFLHRPVYDHKHRTLVIGSSLPTKVIQKGVRERLLCVNCERRLQKYEHYFAKIWYKERRIPSCSADSYFILENLDYAKFKLFALSVVWRASVSDLPEFSAMRLGPHAEPIRQMVLTGRPGSEREYPLLCGLIVEPEDGGIWDKVVMAPMNIRVARHNAVRMVFAGASWTILTSSHASPELDPLCLKSNGTLVMPVVGWQKYADVSGMSEVAHHAPAPDLR
jgi:hypothetical protein